MMYLLRDDGTRYQIAWFSRSRGVATAMLEVLGIAYPATCEWHNCTLLLGDVRIDGVEAGITSFDIRHDSTDLYVVLTWKE
jgi:hypothetical protein